MLEFLRDSCFWVVLSLINLVASILIYLSIKLNQKQKLEFENELSTRPLSKASIILPGSFTFLSVITGVINTLGALLRSQQIHLLAIPEIPSSSTFFFLDTAGHDELLKAKWLVALNDWTSLFMCLTFLVAGLFNFATARQLRLRDRWVKTIVLPAPVMSRPDWYEVEDEEDKTPARVISIIERAPEGPEPAVVGNQ